MTNEQLTKHFIIDLRRLLYLNEIVKYTLEGIKGNPLTPSWFKSAANNEMNCIRHIKSELMRHGKQDSWKDIAEDITDDRLHDIALHLDFIAPVKNVAEITAVLQSSIENQQP